MIYVLFDGNSRRLNGKWFYGEAGNRTCDPCFTRHSAYPLHHGGLILSIDHHENKPIQVKCHNYMTQTTDGTKRNMSS